MDITIPIDCAECGAEVDVTPKQVADGATVTCPRGHSMKFVDKGGGAKSAQKSMDELDEALKNFGKER